MLTRQGWGAVVLAVVIGVIGRMFGVLELFVMGAGILALVAATALWVHARPIRLEVHRTAVPSALQVGETGRIELRLTNLTKGGTSPLVLWEPVAGMGGATLRLAPMRRAETTSAHYRLPATRRGTVTFGPLVVERRDPFGLSTLRRVMPGTHEVIVLPAHFALALPTGAGGAGPLGQHLRMRSLGRSGSEFHSLREYVEGDDLRRINWRASARSETLKVREVEPDGLRRCCVTLDTTADEYSLDGFERAVSAAASAIASADRAALQLRLLIGATVDLRNTSLNAALYRLADCSVSAAETPSFNAPSGEGLGLNIVVTGSAGSLAVAAARRSLNPNDVLVVIACTTMTSQNGTFVIDATDDTEFARSWAEMTGTADLSLTPRPPRSSRSSRPSRQASMTNAS
ncbi:MAG: DUF58 domain-containing protein [Ilumatobacteraceae bacterium]